MAEADSDALKAAQKINNSNRKPNPIDVYVGSRIRLRRLLIGMSQEKLGEELGLTFQQIQKYEKGTNRIGASRLFKLAQILNVSVQYFFEELICNMESNNQKGFSEPDAQSFIIEFLNSREGLELNRAFVKIRDAGVRRRIVQLVQSLSQQSDHDNISE